MINKIKILVVAIMAGSNLFAQNLADFTGIYAVTQRCWEFNNNWQETTEYEVEVNIATNDTTNLEVKVVMFEPYTLDFNIKNDSMFWIYGREYLREDSITHAVGGNGVIYKDSIDLNLGVDHISNQAIDFYRCDCNGNKIREVEPPEATYPIAAPQSEWGYVTFRGPPGTPGSGSVGSIQKYNFKDTVINNRCYRHWSRDTYSRYHNQKLFVLEPFSFDNDSLVERVYYDFNLAVNDTFVLPYFGDNYQAVVNEVNEFETLNGQIRKEILLKTENFTCSHNLRWIEGIGDINNSVFYTNQLGLCDIYDRIVCFSDSSGQVYKERSFEHSCDSLDTYVDIFQSVDETVQTAISIFPNPVKEELKVLWPMLSGKAYNFYRIYNVQGQLVLANKSQLFESIDVHHLKAGTYIIHFLADEISVASGRFVKME